MSTATRIWVNYLRSIGGRKNLRPGEEEAVKQAIAAALNRGAAMSRSQALRVLEEAEKECFFNDGKVIIRRARATICRSPIANVVGVEE